MANFKVRHVTLEYGWEDPKNPSLKLYTDWYLSTKTDIVHIHPWDNVTEKLAPYEISDNDVYFFVVNILQTPGVRSISLSDLQMTIYKFRPTNWEDMIENIESSIRSYLTKDIIYSYS